jgi:hypothetical protein
MSDDALWPKEVEIPIIGVTGEPNSGKTLFLLNLDPWTRDENRKPPTKVWDFEGSAQPYKDSLNFDWVDAGKEVQGYSALAAFEWYQEQLLATPVGQYRVLGVDTMDDVMKGSVEWIRKRPGLFDRTQNQYDRMAPAYLWPDVKSYWKKLLFVEGRARCQTFVMNFHLKNEWQGDRPTGKRTPEGFDVMMKLATLYLWLDRTPKTKGKANPTVPRGLVVKDRLLAFGKTEEDDKPILPPQLPKANGSAIRNYINNPPDYDNLSVAERKPEQVLSDDDKLLLQAGIAQDQAAAAQAQLSHVEQMKAAAAEQAAAMRGDSKPAETPVEPAKYSQGMGEPCGNDLGNRIKALVIEHEGSEEAAMPILQSMVAKRNVGKCSEIPLADAEKLIKDLEGMVAEKGVGEMLSHPPH